MSGFTFTPAETEADPAAIAAYQGRLAKLAPSCSRCGHRLAKGELAARVCRDVEVCRIRRTGCSVAGFSALRKFAASKQGRSAAPVAAKVEQAEPIASPRAPRVAERPARRLVRVAPPAPVSRPQVPSAARSSLVATWAKTFNTTEPRERRWPIV